MRIALYRGKSGVSRLIRWFTRSPYSHAAFVLDGMSVTMAGGWLADSGVVIEAWTSGVRIEADISTAHTPGTRVDFFRYAEPLRLDQEVRLLRLLRKDLGRPYDFRNLIRFVTLRPPRPGRYEVFCSELVAARSADVGAPLFARCNPALISPGAMSWSIGLEADGSAVTV